MAIFGPSMEVERQCPDISGLKEAFVYLEKVMRPGSPENQRLLSLPEGSFEKIMLTDGVFALEQVYATKERSGCFFESHRQYIDIQVIVKGKERIDVGASDRMVIDVPYQPDMDLVKYQDTQSASSLSLKEGDTAIFFPQDAHMPCLRSDGAEMVYKTVVKVPVA